MSLNTTPALLLRAGFAALACILPATPAHAQEAINTDAATQPGPGTLILRQQFRYTQFGDAPAGVLEAGEPTGEEHEFTAETSAYYGVARDLAVGLTVPLRFRYTEDGGGAGSDQDAGFGDLTATVKWRFWRADYGPVDTARASLFGGLEVRSGEEDFSSDSYNPFIGAVFTTIRGRHGFSQDVSWTFMTGDDRGFGRDDEADILRYDTSYLFRLTPAAWEKGITAATYGVVELNGRTDTNGDTEMFLSPGFLFEAWEWAFEASVQVPVIQEVDDRRETEVSLVLGLRFIF